MVEGVLYVIIRENEDRERVSKESKHSNRNLKIDVKQERKKLIYYIELTSRIPSIQKAQLSMMTWSEGW